jgi:Mrp family chromosome partitioning ATPase
MGGGGGPIDIIKKGGIKGLHKSAVSTFKEDPLENILLMGAPMGLKQTQKELGLGDVDIPDPTLPDAANIPTEEETQAAAKRARENERIRRAGTRGRASTIKTGPSGPGSGIQTTFKQLGGR